MDENEENEDKIIHENLHVNPYTCLIRVYMEILVNKVFSIFFIFVHRNSHKVVVFCGWYLTGNERGHCNMPRGDQVISCDLGMIPYFLQGCQKC